MTETVKRLGAVDIPATANTALYITPGSTTTVVSSVSICNRNSTSVKVRLAHTASGATPGGGDWIYYDVTIPANDTLTLTAGLTLATSNQLVGYSDTANVTFLVWGIEIT